MILTRNTTSTITNANKVPYWWQAFAGEFQTIWGDTPYAEEISHMSYLRALTCFVGESYADIEARRQLLYYYSSEFKKDDKEDSINRYYNQLPTKSILKRFLKEVCTAYNKDVQRSFLGVSGRDYGEVFTRYYSDIDTQLKTAYKVARGTGVAAVRPVVIPIRRNGIDTYKLKLQILYPDEFRVRTNAYDETLIESIVFPVSSVADSISNIVSDGRPTRAKGFGFVEFTQDSVNTYDQKYLRTSSQENRYARIPFVFLRLDEGEGFYGHPEFDIVEDSLNANKLQFQSNVSIAFTSSPLWLALNLGASAENIVFSPDAIHAIDNISQDDFPPQIEAIRPDSPFQELEDLKAKRVNNALRDAGLPASVVEGGTVLSGISRLIERLPLSEMQQEDHSRLRAFEQNLFESMRVVLQADASAILPTEQITVSVSFAEEQVIDSAKDTYELDKQKYADGVLSAMEFYNKYANKRVASDEEALQAMNAQAQTTQADANTQQTITEQVV